MSSSTDTNESQNRIATNPGPASPKQKPALFSPKKITPELTPKKGMNFDVAAGRAPYDDQYPISDYVKLSNNNYRSPHKGNRPNRNVSISSDNLKGQAAGGHAYIPRKFSSDNIHADDQQGGGNRPYRTNSGNSPRGNNNNNNNNNNNLNFGKGNNNNYQRNNQRNNQRNQQNNNTNNNNNNNGPGHNKQKPTRSVSGGFAKFAPGSRSQDLQNPSQDIHDFKPNPKKNVE